MKIYRSVIRIVGICVTATLCASGQDLALVKEMRSALDAGLITEQYLANPANAAVVQELRRRAVKYDTEIACVLLKVNDESTVQSLSAQFLRNSAQAENAMACSGNPRLLAFLAEAMSQDESPKRFYVGTGERDMALHPISVTAASTIARLVANSSAFPAPVIAWAKQLINMREQHPGERREQVRHWWAQNKEAIAGGQYSDVRPPM